MNLKKILAVLALIAVAGLAGAQGMFDMFAFPRVIVVFPPQSVGGTTTVTNTVDTHGFAGIARLDVSCWSVAGNATNNITVQTSADQTNWVNLANAAYSTATSIIYTNTYYGGTNLLGTNVYNLAGTLTTVTPGTAGYAAPYGEIINPPAPFTNTVSAIVVSNAVVSIGFNIGDGGHYLHVIASSGTLSTNVFSAVLTARKSGF